jgi:dihydrofolate synthase / folylpolyglutamate synthase
MQTSARKTPTILPGTDLFEIIRMAVAQLPDATLPEKSVLAITSKVVSICEGRLVPLTAVDKHELVRQESELYLEPHSSKYGVMLTIKDGVLAVTAGIDESNVQDAYVLYPENSWESARKIWEFLRSEYGLKEVGVIITDSTSFPLRWGVVGRSLAFCGFQGLNNRIGELDLFGREIKMTQVNVAEGLAGAAVFEMGEVAESTPLCLFTDIPHIVFNQAATSAAEIASLQILLEDDVYAPLLTSVNWLPGSKQTGSK